MAKRVDAKNTMPAKATPAIAPLDKAGVGESESVGVKKEWVTMDVAVGVVLEAETGPGEADDGEGEGDGDTKFSTTLSQSSLIGWLCAALCIRQ